MAIPLYNESKSARIDLLNVENRGSTAMITFKVRYFDNTVRTIRTNVKNLGGYRVGFLPKTIRCAEFLRKVYIGILKSDVRLLFVAAMADGTVQLLQEKQGSSGCTKLLSLCSVEPPEYIPPPPKEERSEAPKYTNVGHGKKAEPYNLKTNELPQGEYLIGKDIPVGTFDFFVVYGTGGCFNIMKLDSDGKIIDGTWDFFWVGLKEDYEKRELIHVNCKEGYTIKLDGNVILKIARSKQVKIEL